MVSLFGICYKSPVWQHSKKIIATAAMVLLIKESDMSFIDTQSLLSPSDDSSGTIEESSLTSRQLDVLCLLVKGMTSKQIGKALFLSPRTIEEYLDLIKMKLNCENR